VSISSNSVDGKTALVTRAGRGIGRAIALGLAMQARIREQDPDQIGTQLHQRFTASYQQGTLISAQQSAESLLAHLDTGATGQIWDVSDPT
jgi:NAD(P)-dependent dehydrogenase (short-subunit alcohol dehydrogenase family)